VGIPSNSLKGLGEFVTWNALRIVISAVLVLALLVAWLSNHPSSVYVAMLDIVLLFAVAGPIYLYFSYRRIPGPFALDSTTWRPMLGFGLPCVLTTLPQTLNLRLDQMLMAGLLPANLLGLYVVAVAWSGMLTPVLSSVSLVFYPRLASYPTREEQSRAFVRVVRLAVPIAVVLALGLALITPWGLTLAFGKGFAASTRCSFILIGAAAILNVNLIIEEGFRGFGLPVSVLWAELGGLVVTGVALLLLLKPMGIEGAAIASVLGYGAVGILLLVRARVITGSSFAEMLLPKRSELRAEWARLRIALSI
jgi:O-antigen/teichoic acid export membrane protein